MSAPIPVNSQPVSSYPAQLEFVGSNRTQPNQLPGFQVQAVAAGNLQLGPRVPEPDLRDNPRRKFVAPGEGFEGVR